MKHLEPKLPDLQHLASESSDIEQGTGDQTISISGIHLYHAPTAPPSCAPGRLCGAN